MNATLMIETSEAPRQLEGNALCLSGGGFRATLFHLGALRRLNELGVLAQLSIVTSVSGGSILNGLLALRWKDLSIDPNGSFSNFVDVIANPIEQFCQSDLRTELLIGARLDPTTLPTLFRNYFAVPANLLAEAYEPLFRRRLLAEIIDPGINVPRFIFCATSLQTGACWQFHCGATARMGDFYTGYTSVGSTSVASAVAASSAFPPGFAALRLSTSDLADFTRIDPWGRDRELSKKRKSPFAGKPREILLTDGGVYDNLGVEPIWNSKVCLLLSDAGRPFFSEKTCRQSIGARLSRSFSIAAEQVGAVRKRWLFTQLESGRQGAMWSIDTPIESYEVPGAKGYCTDVQHLACDVRTDLNSFSLEEIGCLENHGYSLADAAMHRSPCGLVRTSSRKFNWPYENVCSDGVARQALGNSASRHILHDVLAYFRRSVIGRNKAQKGREPSPNTMTCD